MKRSVALKRFLSTAPSTLAQLYTDEMEVQVMVEQREGEKIIKKHNSRSYSVYTDGDIEWSDFRMPVNANNDPIDNDYDIKFPLTRYCKAVGMTGWNWKKRQSQWFGFDFDSIANHKNGITEEELAEVKKRLEEIEWVDVYSSTSGKGLHAYVFLDHGFPTQNHNEHSAVARSILTLMSAEVGFNFGGAVDCFGGVMWVYHLKNEGTNGLRLLKPAKHKFPVGKIPRNWKDHKSVTSGKAKRIKSNGGVDGLVKAVQDVNLTSAHRMVLNWLARNAKRTFWWDTDNYMIVGHTKDFEDCHRALGLAGIFATVASGEDDKQNCFAFPLKNGRWSIRRYAGASEHKCWTSDDKGWTKIVFNAHATFREACLYYDGLETEKGEMVFQNIENETPAYYKVSSTMKVLGVDFTTEKFSAQLHTRDVTLKHIAKDNRVAIRVPKEKSDYVEKGWISEAKNWLTTVQYNEGDIVDDVEDIDLDNYIRYCIKDDAEAGVYIQVDEKWVGQSQSNVDAVLGYLLQERGAGERLAIKGRAVLKPWYLDNEPFQDEYPGGRKWNKDSAQLAYSPEKTPFPTWASIMNHIGESLTPIVKNCQWCQKHGITDGADYLMLWVSYMFQEPEQHLPYLFITSYGQNSGKSTFHEALSLLFKNGRGYCKAQNALQDKYNPELAGAILAVVEEVDLGADMSAYNKMKDYVTAPLLAINTKYKSVYMTKNYVKWVQVANNPAFCPIFEGDTRVLVIEVNPLKPEDEIDKTKLMEMLREEAPGFLYEVLNTHLPEKFGRLAIPVLETSLKTNIQASNRNVLEEFCEARCYNRLGHKVKVTEFTDIFIKALKTRGMIDEVGKWHERRVKAQYPKSGEVYIGRLDSDGLDSPEYIFNMSLDSEAENFNFKFKNVNGVIVKEELS